MLLFYCCDSMFTQCVNSASIESPDQKLSKIVTFLLLLNVRSYVCTGTLYLEGKRTVSSIPSLPAA